MVWLRPRFRGSPRLGAIESLDPIFLVHAQHQRMFGRLQIQTDDIFQFFRELRIVADLEAFQAGRFQPVTVPETMVVLCGVIAAVGGWNDFSLGFMIFVGW